VVCSLVRCVLLKVVVVLAMSHYDASLCIVSTIVEVKLFRHDLNAIIKSKDADEVAQTP